MAKTCEIKIEKTWLRCTPAVEVEKEDWQASQKRSDLSQVLRRMNVIYELKRDGRIS